MLSNTKAIIQQELLLYYSFICTIAGERKGFMSFIRVLVQK